MVDFVRWAVCTGMLVAMVACGPTEPPDQNNQVQVDVDTRLIGTWVSCHSGATGYIFNSDGSYVYFPWPLFNPPGSLLDTCYGQFRTIEDSQLDMPEVWKVACDSLNPCPRLRYHIDGDTLRIANENPLEVLDGNSSTLMGTWRFPADSATLTFRDDDSVVFRHQEITTTLWYLATDTLLVIPPGDRLTIHPESLHYHVEPNVLYIGDANPDSWLRLCRRQ